MGYRPYIDMRMLICFASWGSLMESTGVEKEQDILKNSLLLGKKSTITKFCNTKHVLFYAITVLYIKKNNLFRFKMLLSHHNFTI